MSTELDDTPQPLMEHLIELRRRLIWSLVAFFAAFVGCFVIAKRLFELLVVPYKTAVQLAHLDVANSQLIYTAPQEFFFTQIKVAMFGAMVIAFPVIATQIYKFVAPGLYKNERAAFLPFLIHADGDVVLSVDATEAGIRADRYYPDAESVRISESDHDFGIFIWLGVPVARDHIAPCTSGSDWRGSARVEA